MSWLPTTVPLRTLGEALALRPDLRAGYDALLTRLRDGSGVDPALLTLAERRVATLAGGVAAPAPDTAALGPREQTVLDFSEQFVLDPHGVTDDQVAALRARFSPAQVVAIAQAVAVFEGLARLAHALGVAPEL